MYHQLETTTTCDDMANTIHSMEEYETGIFLQLREHLPNHQRDHLVDHLAGSTTPTTPAKTPTTTPATSQAINAGGDLDAVYHVCVTTLCMNREPWAVHFWRFT